MPLPPPSALKRKILIKNKRLKPEVEKIELELFQQGQLALDNEEPTEDANAVPVLDKKLTEDAATPVASGLPGASQDGGEGIEIPINYTGSTTNVHPWLSSMINYAQPIKFQAFDSSERKFNRTQHITHIFTLLRLINSKTFLSYREEYPPQYVIILRNGRHELLEATGHRFCELQQTPNVSNLSKGNACRFIQLYAPSVLECWLSDGFIEFPNQRSADAIESRQIRVQW